MKTNKVSCFSTNRPYRMSQRPSSLPRHTVCLKQKLGAYYRKVRVVCAGVNAHPNPDVNPTHEPWCTRNQGVVGLPAAAVLLQSDPNIGNELKQRALWEEEVCVWHTKRQQHMMEKEKGKSGIMDTSASLSLCL